MSCPYVSSGRAGACPRHKNNRISNFARKNYVGNATPGVPAAEGGSSVYDKIVL